MEKPNFKTLCKMHIQELTNFPFIEQDFDFITNYQFLCQVIDHLNQVIENSNKQNDVITQLYNAFVELKDYVDNYFDNLDVQDEINNKLDEMVEDGTLQEIIASYLNSKAIFGFDTVASMKEATNLINGSYAQTLGFYTKNDGGNAIYKIRNITNEDIVDNIKIIALNNTNLIAELIIDDYVNVKCCGVKGDNLTDNTILIQQIIDTFPNKTIFFPNGVYGITSHIDTSADNTKSVSLKLDDFAVIKALSNYNDEKAMICLGGKNYNNYFLYDNFSNYGVDGGTIDCNGIANGISVQNAVQTYIKNIKINHCPLIGINIVNGSNNNSADALVSNCIIIGTNNTQAIGLNVSAADNLFENIRIFHCKYGVYITGGGNHFNNIHCLATSNDLNENYENMVAFYIKGNYNYFNYAYSDNYATGFYLDGLRRTMVSDYYCYYWADDDTHQHTAIQCSSRMTGRFNNVHCRFPAAGTNTILKVANKTLSDGFIKTLTIHNVNNLNDANDLGYNPLFNKDPILLDTTKLTNVLNDLTINQNSITACDSVINYNIILSGATIPSGTATKVFELPDGFVNPNENVNLYAKLINSTTYKRIVCYTTPTGSVFINPAEEITSAQQYQIIGSALNTQFSS